MAKPTPTTTWRKLTAFWLSRTGIDWPTWQVVFKDTVAPAIGLAANQAAPWKHVFATLGFLVPMASIIARPSPSRGEFLWLLGTNVLGSCVSAAVTALAFLCVVTARRQSEGAVADSSNVPYNAVASTVAALWLMAQTYVASAIRYSYPQTTWMISACLIFSNYVMVYAIQFPDMTAAWSFLQAMLLAHLVGFAISAGVSLVVFPTNDREHFFETVSECTREMRLALRTNIEVMDHAVLHPDSPAPLGPDDAWNQHRSQLDSLRTRLVVQLAGAQREIAWGVLAPADLSTLTHLLEEAVIPLVGLCRVPDVMKRTLRDDDDDDDNDNDGDNDGDNDEPARMPSRAEYGTLLASVVGPFSQASAAASECLRRSEIALGLDSHPTGHNNAASNPEMPLPQLRREMDILVDSKATLLDAWRRRHGDPARDSATDGSLQPALTLETSHQSRGHLHMLLYTEFLLWSICHRIQELVVWIEAHRASRKLARKQLMLPDAITPRSLALTLGRWMGSLRDIGSDPSGARRTSRRRDRDSPSHLHRAIVLRAIRGCTDFFASPASGFALRVTSATMCIAIVAFLPSTQRFYIRQHLIWAQYTVSYAMQGSAGQGVRALVFRMGGTIVAVCLAWISWYVVVGVPAGVLVLYWLSLHFPMSVMARQPRYHVVGTVSAFAITTILGNALQPNGTGQPAIMLGAIRLAAIGGGCLLATIWTLFPFPISEHDGARRSLGACLACLAQYHTGLHEIVRIRLGEGLAPGSSHPRSRALEDVHSRLMAKCGSHLQVLQSRLRLTKWNVLPSGVRFSRAHYRRACDAIDHLIGNMQLLAFATRIFIDFVHDRSPTPSNRSMDWLGDFRLLFDAAQNDGLGVATLLGLLSHSVRHGTPLPPRLTSPGADRLWRYFDEPERVTQQISRIDDPGAAMFALMRIGTEGLYHDLGELLHVIREMVGEYEFVCGFAVDDEE